VQRARQALPPLLLLLLLPLRQQMPAHLHHHYYQRGHVLAEGLDVQEEEEGTTAVECRQI
jgi:hypothetical protein